MNIEIIEKTNEQIKKVFNKSIADNANYEHQLYLMLKYQGALLRQGTASTTTRGEVTGGGSKPYRQKGTGHARRGTNRSPLRRGGGIIFGPKYRTYSQKINKQVISKTLQMLLANKPIAVINSVDANFKTKDLRSVFNKNEKFYVVINEINDSIFLKCRNFKNVVVAEISSLDINDILSSDKILFSEEAWNKMEEINKDG